MREGFTDWNAYYRTGMKVLGREVPLVCAPVDLLKSLGYEQYGFVVDIFAYNIYYDHRKIYRDIPEFRPSVSLEDGMRRVIHYCDKKGTIPNCDDYPMDDKLAEYLLQGRTLQ